MAKIRTLKGEFFRNAGVSCGGLVTKTLAAGIICTIADDDGRFKVKAADLKGEIFTHDPVSIKQVEQALKQLADEDFIRLYTDHGRAFGVVVNWKSHQPVPPSRYIPSVLPAPPNTKRRKHSPTSRKRPSTDASSRAGVGSDRSGKEGIGEHGDIAGGGASVNGLTFEQAAANLVATVDHDVTTLCSWLLDKRGWETFGSMTALKAERQVAKSILELGIEDLYATLEERWAKTDPDDRPSSLRYFWQQLQDAQHQAVKQQQRLRTSQGMQRISETLK